MVMVMQDHMEKLKRTRTSSWLLIAREERKFRNRLHSNRKILQSKGETENLTHANRVFLEDVRVESHILVNLLLISPSKFIYS